MGQLGWQMGVKMKTGFRLLVHIGLWRFYAVAGCLCVMASVPVAQSKPRSVYTAPPTATPPQWNIPAAVDSAFSVHTNGAPQPSTPPVDSPVGFLALPDITRPVLRLTSPPTPKLASGATQPQATQSLWLMRIPSPPGERLFNNVSHLAAAELLLTLQRTLGMPVHSTEQTNNPAQLADVAHNYQKTHTLPPLQPLLPDGRYVVLLECWIDTQHSTQPGTPKGWLQWWASDTLPPHLTYALLMQATLISLDNNQVIWQGQERANLSNAKLASLSRQVEVLPSNQLALQQASREASVKLANLLTYWLKGDSNTNSIQQGR
jgi:hypothetical protein